MYLNFMQHSKYRENWLRDTIVTDSRTNTVERRANPFKKVSFYLTVSRQFPGMHNRSQVSLENMMKVHLGAPILKV